MAGKEMVPYRALKKMFRDGRLLEPGDTFTAEVGLESKAKAFERVKGKAAADTQAGGNDSQAGGAA